jgi:RimK family alpha-L-glutamate ligase
VSDTLLMKNIISIQLKEEAIPFFDKTFRKFYILSSFTKFKELTYKKSSIFYKGTPLEQHDFIFIGLTGKSRDLAPIVIDYIKRYNIPFICYGHKTADHAKTFEIYKLTSDNIPIIPSLISSDQNAIADFIIQYTQLFITKPINGKKGREILQHSSLESIMDAIQKSEIPLIIQPMIPNDGDYRVWILKGKVIGVIKRSPNTEGEFRSNISLGGSAQLAELPDDVLDMAIKSAKILDLDMAGVDIIQDINTKKYYIMEVNAAPQFNGFMATTGINLFEIITKHIIQEIESKK